MFRIVLNTGSEKHKNILMWGHYADSHRGICIGFDYSKLLVSTGVDFLVCNKDWINSEEVEKIKQADKEVYLWTSNSIEDWENAKSIGVDGIMTDDVIGAAEFFN